MPDPQHYPLFVIITHALNILFITLLARSGIEVLSAFPKFYWNDGCQPGREWARFSTKAYGADSRRPWTSLDEDESWHPIIALPGRKHLGLPIRLVRRIGGTQARHPHCQHHARKRPGCGRRP